ncbi:hypothetical protein [Saccharolobus caldissimus]|uniref:Uncharacterized protein n=1 Tax=Saccharolobus caldissimus TaxID=1702097 RepID=A0AAQ4CWL2_9CREN|nr:hypothetical protein [Saccharolobus caldissimus]BDC00194.1 hypothetical protein SACC_32100 [Saccharolobus caldissimus]
MLSWLLGSPALPWSDLEDIFQEYNNVAVYIDNGGLIQMIKVSDIDEFYTQFSVLIHPKYFKTYKLYYIKLRKFVAFPTLREDLADYLISLKGWRGIKYYYSDEFLGAWILYDCINCRDKQRAHLQIDEKGKLKDIVNRHLEIYNS